VKLQTYIDRMFEITGAQELQLEVHVDREGNVNELSPNVVRFNVKRETPVLVTKPKFESINVPPVQPTPDPDDKFQEELDKTIKKELRGERVGKRYQELPKNINQQSERKKR
jgi:hypothetical protein